MKRIMKFGIAGLVLTPAMALAAMPGEWTGPYVGGQVGWTQTKTDHFSSENALNLGVLGGYTAQLSEHLTVGGDVFYQWNQQKDHSFSPGPGTSHFGSTVYGVDGMVGFPVGEMGRFMPYVKLGYGSLHGTGDASGTESAVRYGAGLAWRLSTPVSVSFQYMHQKFGSSSDNWKNDTFSLGVAYHF